MSAMRVEIGDRVHFSKTVGETDVYMFAGVTGDFSGNHVNEEFMKKSKYGRRIAHGALLVGYMSTASTLMIDRSLSKGIDSTPVALGYDRVRFLAPVFLGDTITVGYEISEVDESRRRTRAQVDVTNQSGVLVAVAEHLIKWVANESEGAEPPATAIAKARAP
jgi:3-hydroxybutyryl-CoA dehydratase